jgi:hypothetical protein
MVRVYRYVSLSVASPAVWISMAILVMALGCSYSWIYTEVVMEDRWGILERMEYFWGRVGMRRGWFWAIGDFKYRRIGERRC